ncbi:hypothetical protein GL50803_0014949 [Giardia duodenalis]|uniref:Uncharacterized protein n=1 Tax=Giardia intestinalis (strain ATCC 50803 / WB clone C6) TaxID=184922 RepID=D3KH08_GIAIC|nr:hypothetical protein GL50803_0014949 [Giardia intestinalis]KAE8304235.1 hypothetical protein GL50803_0014949 [Giardia intestinalis]
MQIGCVGPAVPTLFPIDLHMHNAEIYAETDISVPRLSPVAEAGRVYFRVGKEVIYWCSKTGVFGSLCEHASSVICIAAGSGRIYSADESSIFCWNLNTHTKLAEISVKNTALLWACGDILLIIGMHFARSYKLSENILSLFHDLPLAPQMTLGTIISAGVVQTDTLYSYFLVVQVQEDQEIDNYVHIWTTRSPFNHASSAAQSRIAMRDVFPQFTEHVERTDLPLLTDLELRSVKARYRQHLTVQSASIPCDQSNSMVQLTSDKTLSASSRQLPGTRGRTVLDVRVLLSNHVLCVCKDMLYLYGSDWSILSRKDLAGDTVLASYIHLENNYLVVGHVSGYVSIYNCTSLALITTLDLRQHARVNGAILAVAFLDINSYPNVFVVFRIGAVFLGDIASRSIAPCLGLCTHPAFIIPFRDLCLVTTGTTTLRIISFQTSFSPKLHVYVPRSFFLEPSFHGPCLDFVIDPYYQHYAFIVTDTHLILLEALMHRPDESRSMESYFRLKHIRKCSKKGLTFDSNSYQAGCFVAGPLAPTQKDLSQNAVLMNQEENMPLWICLLTDQELHLLSVPALDSLAAYSLFSRKCTFNALTSFLACDRGVAYGDYLLLSTRYQKSVSVLATTAEPPYIRICGVYSLASMTLSCAAVHPSSMYTVIVHDVGVGLYTLPDCKLVSVSAHKIFDEGEHTIYFDPVGAYFLVSTVFHKHNASTLTIYEFGTGSVHCSLDFNGRIRQIVFSSDVHAILSDDRGNMYELLYDIPMIAVITDMKKHLKSSNNSVTYLWAAMDDVKWD